MSSPNPQNVDADQAAAPLLRLQEVCKVYQGAEHQVTALDRVSLSVHRGDYITLMGPSGSGKSTLLNVMGGVDKPSSGEVYLDAERIDRLGEQRLLAIRRRKVSYVLQEARLLPSLTALENVMLPTAFSKAHRKGARKRALSLLEQVGLERRAGHLVHQLSGGEAQRVCIARALINQPMLILADEPTGNLDHQTRLDIVDQFEELNREGNTIVMVTHDPELAARGNRRMDLRDGRLEERGMSATLPPN